MKQDIMDIQVRDSEGDTALNVACQNVDFTVFKYLVEELQADVETRNYRKRTLLHTAFHGRVEIAKYLLQDIDSNIDIEARDANGYTALQLACTHKSRIELIDLLMEHSCREANEAASSMELPVGRKHIALYFVALHEYDMITTSRFFLCESGWEEGVATVTYLVEQRHASLVARDESGRTAIDIARMHKRNEILDYLLTSKIG